MYVQVMVLKVVEGLRPGYTFTPLYFYGGVTGLCVTGRARITITSTS